MRLSLISSVLYVLLKLVFNRHYEGQDWLDSIYFVVESLCYTLILADLYKLHWVFEIVFYVALSSFIRQLLIYLGIWEYVPHGRKYLVEIFFIFGILLVSAKNGNRYFRKVSRVD